MCSDELYKFSDGRLTSVRSVLHDIASNVRMDYLPKRRWSNLDKQRSRIMIKVIDKLQLERRLMRNLEKFVGRRDYGKTSGCLNGQYDFVIFCPTPLHVILSRRGPNDTMHNLPQPLKDPDYHFITYNESKKKREVEMKVLERETRERPNGDTLRKYILEGPYTPSTVIIPVVPATNNSLAVSERTTVETVLNLSPENKSHFESEKEVIHLILTRIGDEIYSTIDACKTAHEMWEAIERLQQGESLNIQDVKTNLFWEFGKFTSHNGVRLHKFVTIVKQQYNLDEVSYHKLFDILKQYQKEVNELRAERIAKNANPLALVATAQPHQEPYYQTSKSHKSYAQTS
ncbi:hypothetical protein Tco_0180339 [Tanacetum coccineum]